MTPWGRRFPRIGVEEPAQYEERLLLVEHPRGEEVGELGEQATPAVPEPEGCLVDLMLDEVRAFLRLKGSLDAGSEAQGALALHLVHEDVVDVEAVKLFGPPGEVGGPGPHGGAHDLVRVLAVRDHGVVVAEEDLVEAPGGLDELERSLEPLGVGVELPLADAFEIDAGDVDERGHVPPLREKRVVVHKPPPRKVGMKGPALSPRLHEPGNVQHGVNRS